MLSKKNAIPHLMRDLLSLLRTENAGACHDDIKKDIFNSTFFLNQHQTLLSCRPTASVN